MLVVECLSQPPVYRLLVNALDVDRLSRLHVAAEQDELVREFTRLLVRTYSGALASYRDQTIEVMPLRAKSGDTEVTVRTRIRQPGAESVIVEYDLAKGDSGWKVFDIRVAGISLVATYRSTFAEEIAERAIVFDRILQRTDHILYLPMIRQK